MNIDVDQFWKDGFLILPKVFTAEEISRFRSRAEIGANAGADLLSDSVLQDAIIDERTRRIATALLGDTPTYFGDSTVSLTPAGSGFHKDNTDRHDLSAPDWQTDRYPLIRFGIYLQGHETNPGGLDLLRGSHVLGGQHEGEFCSAQTRIGDIVVWTLRTSHSANSQIFRFGGRRLAPSSPFWRLRHYLIRTPWSFLMRRQREQRMALFFTVGAAGTYLDRYIKYLKTREYALDIWRNSHVEASTRERAARAGINVLDYQEILKSA